MNGIGGSDAAAAIGMSPWKSPYTLWCEKTGIINNDVDNEAMRLGRDLEDYVASRFMEETGKKVHRSSFSFQNAEYPFMLANVDRIVVGEDAGLECKTTSALTRTKYDKGDIPIQYYVQCMHYMAVTGKKKWYIAILVLGIGFYWFEVNWDDEEIANLIQAEGEFWRYVIENKVKQEMGNAEYAGTYGYSIKWKNVTSNRVDSKLLKEKYPDVYNDVLKTSQSRRFEIKKEEYEQ